MQVHSPVYLCTRLCTHAGTVYLSQACALVRGSVSKRETDERAISDICSRANKGVFLVAGCFAVRDRWKYERESNDEVLRATARRTDTRANRNEKRLDGREKDGGSCADVFELAGLHE